MAENECSAVIKVWKNRKENVSRTIVLNLPAWTQQSKQKSIMGEDEQVRVSISLMILSSYGHSSFTHLIESSFLHHLNPCKSQADHHKTNNEHSKVQQILDKKEQRTQKAEQNQTTPESILVRQHINKLLMSSQQGKIFLQ